MHFWAFLMQKKVFKHIYFFLMKILNLVIPIFWAFFTVKTYVQVKIFMKILYLVITIPMDFWAF